MTAGTGSTAASDAGARRAERLAIAESMLSSPPPLDALAPSRVRVLERSVVHASRSRPVVRWTVGLESQDRTWSRLAVIGKGYLRGGGPDAWQLLAALRDAGLDGPELQVPAPFGFDPVRQLLAQEEAPPTTLHSLLDGDPGPAAPDAERAGRWLARLHAVRDVGVPDLVEGFEQLKLTEYAAALAGQVPGSPGRLSRLTVGTLEALARVQGPRVVTHGDYQPKNIHLDRSRMVVIDFDRAALAPAGRDLGHFVGQTLTMGASRHGSLSAATSWVEAFGRGYVGAGGDADAVRTASAYVARTFAEVLFYRLVVRPVGTTAFVPEWLDAWEAAVDAAVDGRP